MNQVAASLEAAWRTYEEELDYPNRLVGRKVPVDIHDLPDDGGQVIPLPLGGPEGTILEAIELDPLNSAPIYLARHEFFHFFEYAYVDFNDLVELPIAELWTESKARWWLEATAEWAAHQAGLSAHLPAPLRIERTSYDEFIDNYFATIDLPIDRFGGGVDGISVATLRALRGANTGRSS